MRLRTTPTEPGSEQAKASLAPESASTRAALFREMYDSHFRLVWRALSRLGVHESDLMDLTQKVFFTAYLKLPKFEGRSLLSTWLWGICRRVASGYRRSGSVRYEVATDP
ncbi:MAG TPA: sigma factor, partial [Polyangiaceae bacterium]